MAQLPVSMDITVTPAVTVYMVIMAIVASMVTVLIPAAVMRVCAATAQAITSVCMLILPATPDFVSARVEDTGPLKYGIICR